MKLMPHQQRAVDRNAKKEMWCWATRTGKTAPASMWSNHPCRNSNPYVICLKKDKKAWQREAPHATVLTKEEFKKAWDTIDKPSCVLVDESHVFHSALFTKQRSQMATALYSFIRKWPDMDVLLTTATPVRNDPSSMHTALCYIGHYIPWKEYQEKMYRLVKKPYSPWPFWEPRSNWRELVKPLLEKYADIVTLSDVVDYLPPETHELIEVPMQRYQYQEDEDQRWTTEHQHEQTDKAKYIIELGDKSRKLLVIAQYTKTIEDLAVALSKHKPVFVLSGKTKDGDAVIREAQEADDCYFIVQASMCSGFNGYQFDAMIFTAMSHKVVDFLQAIGRLHHTQFIKPAIYYYLLAHYPTGKSWDKKVYDSIREGKDFYDSTGTTKGTKET